MLSLTAINKITIKQLCWKLMKNLRDLSPAYFTLTVMLVFFLHCNLGREMVIIQMILLVSAVGSFPVKD